jgi:hypothetical protein
MAGRLLSVIIAGVIGAVVISLVIPLILLPSLTGLVPADQVPAITAIVEWTWLLIAVPIVLFLTGVAAAHLARKHLKGLIYCVIISVSAGAIAILPGLVILMNHVGGFSALMLAAFSVAMLLASIAGSFVYFYFYRIRAKTF